MAEKKEQKCIFCEVANKKLPSYLVHENDNFVAVLDVNPFAEGHTLIISKNHVVNYLFSEEKDNKGLQEFVKNVSDFLKAKLNVDGISILTNNFYGQDIPHLHWHIIPRYENDKINFNVDKKIKLEDVAKKLATNEKKTDDKIEKPKMKKN